MLKTEFKVLTHCGKVYISILIDSSEDRKKFYCQECKGYTYDVDYCDNPSCPDMPCCAKPRELYSCDSGDEMERIEKLTDHNTNVVAQFMQHCQDEGYTLPDHLFESYFGA